jgi:DNA (cytosine-5)-methyltransferase 1
MTDLSDKALLHRLLEIYDQTFLASYLNDLSPDRWCRETINRWVKDKASPAFTHAEYIHLQKLLPEPKVTPEKPEFKFIDLFAGIGGIRKGFESEGGQCVFTSEWNKYAVRTYKANFACNPDHHKFNEDIRDITLSDRKDVTEEEAYEHIKKNIPDHDVLLAGFPCQPFSIAGVSKKNSLGRVHGFECTTQGTLFFDVARIISAKRPPAFVLENVKNLKSHDKGKTFQIIMETLDELGYEVADKYYDNQDPKIIDGQHFLPQHRERIVLVGFRKDLNVHHGFSLAEISRYYPDTVPKLRNLLEKDKDVDPKYILTPKLWEYLYRYAQKHKEKGNGFGFGLVNGDSITRTLSARYYKDGSEILIDRGWDFYLDFNNSQNMEKRPRRLTPRECARLMGFSEAGKDDFRIPVSDTQAYKQFGNSVVVPVFKAVARLMKPHLLEAIKLRENCERAA